MFGLMKPLKILLTLAVFGPSLLWICGQSQGPALAGDRAFRRDELRASRYIDLRQLHGVHRCHAQFGPVGGSPGQPQCAVDRWLVFTAGLIGLGVCSSLAGLIISMIIMGLGLGAIELGANGLMIQLHSADRGRYLNLLSVFHGCGSLIVPWPPRSSLIPCGVGRPFMPRAG